MFRIAVLLAFAAMAHAQSQDDALRQFEKKLEEFRQKYKVDKQTSATEELRWILQYLREKEEKKRVICKPQARVKLIDES